MTTAAITPAYKVNDRVLIGGKLTIVRRVFAADNGHTRYLVDDPLTLPVKVVAVYEGDLSEAREFVEAKR